MMRWLAVLCVVFCSCSSNDDAFRYQVVTDQLEECQQELAAAEEKHNLECERVRVEMYAEHMGAYSEEVIETQVSLLEMLQSDRQANHLDGVLKSVEECHQRKQDWESGMNDPQSELHKEYTRRIRSLETFSELQKQTAICDGLRDEVERLRG